MMATSDRPAVSVVVPFHGDAAEARATLAGLGRLRTREGDEVVLADNTRDRVMIEAAGEDSRVVAVDALIEHSPAHARNIGVERSAGAWLLFLDADCRPEPTILDDYFSRRVGERCGALAGGVVGEPSTSLAARFATARRLLDQADHLAADHRPRAVTANLLVRREVWEAVGGFLEGLRAGEDADFSWRMQDAGWELRLCEGAVVRHHHRECVAELARQWRGYAAAAAWLERRHPGYRATAPVIGPVVKAAVKIVLFAATGRLKPACFAALDIRMALEVAVGRLLDNRPAPGPAAPAGPPSEVTMLADQFPARGGDAGAVARGSARVRVEAAARPVAPDLATARSVSVHYREDDGTLTRLRALAWLLARHPVHAASDSRGAGPGLCELAPVVRRRAADRHARLTALDGDAAQEVARRVERLVGRI